MKFYCLADLHFTEKQPVARLDNAAEARLNKFSTVLRASEIVPLSAVVVAGDFFDKPKEWEVLWKVANVLSNSKASVVSCFGQHDVSFYQFDKRQGTSLGVLNESNLVYCPHKQHALKVKEGKSTIGVYGVNFEDKKIPKPTCDKNILIIHASIADTEARPGGSYEDAVDFASKHQEYELIVCGDIHREFLKKVGKTTILNPGPLLRATADEYNFTYKPGYYLYDTETRKAKRILFDAEPAEEVLTRNHIEQGEANKEMLGELVEQIRRTKIRGVNLIEEIRKGLKKHKLSNGAKEVVREVIDG